MADRTERYRPARSQEIKAHARRLLYLGDVGKIMVALANEYGANRPLPSRQWVAAQLEARRTTRFTVRALA